MGPASQVGREQRQEGLLGTRHPAYQEGTPENKTGTLLAFMALSAMGKTMGK